MVRISWIARVWELEDSFLKYKMWPSITVLSGCMAFYHNIPYTNVPYYKTMGYNQTTNKINYILKYFFLNSYVSVNNYSFKFWTDSINAWKKENTILYYPISN